jgi:hypothetical protein
MSAVLYPALIASAYVITLPPIIYLTVKFQSGFAPAAEAAEE